MERYCDEEQRRDWPVHGPALRVAGGTGPDPALPLLADTPSRIAFVAAPCLRPRGAGNATPWATEIGTKAYSQRGVEHDDRVPQWWNW